jgi:hypothetical protein
MPYFVSWIKDGRVRKFLYPHVGLDTAMALASEVLLTDGGEVRVIDGNGQEIADCHAVAQYAAEADGDYASETDEN